MGNQLGNRRVNDGKFEGGRSPGEGWKGGNLIGKSRGPIPRERGTRGERGGNLIKHKYLEHVEMFEP